jgi:hypothetical protein
MTSGAGDEQLIRGQSSGLGRLRQSLPPRLPLVALTLLVLLAYVLAYLGRQAARRHNRNVINTTLTQHFRQPSSADLVMGERTQQLLEEPCRLSRAASCPENDPDESPMIQRIRAGATEVILRQRLANNTYADASELLADLIDQRHQTSATNAVITGFDGARNEGASLIAFAVKLNLEPALVYRVVGREEAAVEQLQFFTDLTLPIVRKGYWVSASGLDVTDLPVLNSAFCSSADQLSAKRCGWALLSAIAETINTDAGMSSSESFEFDSFEFDLRQWAANRRGLDLSSAYAHQSQLFANSELSRYLDAIGQLGSRHATEAHDILKRIPAFVSPAQEALWYYQLGRSALLLAAWGQGIADCERFKREAIASFRHVLHSDPGGLLARPAIARIADTNQICTSSN